MNEHAMNDFEIALKEYFAHRREESRGDRLLYQAMQYSILSGGKRFRPQLCLAVGEALGLPSRQVFPLAMSIEAVHTYSLIHDDLPSMDNDDFRRGQPTCHKKFSEDVALLAGDGLLTEAFLILARSYPEVGCKLVEELSLCAGPSGMILGQILDLGHGQAVESLEDLIHLHELKTGRLIAVCFSGPMIIAGRSKQEAFDLGLQLGLAFQVKDDLLDAEDTEQTSFINFLGVKGTESYLASLTEKIHRAIGEMGLGQSSLPSLVDFNLSRQK